MAFRQGFQVSCYQEVNYEDLQEMEISKSHELFQRTKY